MNITKLGLYNSANTPAFGTDSAPKTEEIEIISTRKAKPVFDINKELANQTFIRPLPPNGHIVRGGILDAPKSYFQDVKTDMVALSNAIKGDANDHQLGKLNDLGLKVGGLAIASYLFSVKKAPVSKWMEFVGLGSFLGSMALWPKLALEFPCRMLHGFNPFMQYEDSRGCKKQFFQDNQYIPFDILSDKDINRIGNKLNVPENLFNRRDAVQEKMRQIALQNNTMWMLTAGFATPVMSALICNTVEPYVDNIQNFFLNNKLDKLLSNFNDVVASYKTDNVIKAMDALITTYEGQPITGEVIGKLTDIISSKADPNVKIGIVKDLEEMFQNGQYRISEIMIKPLQKHITEALEYSAGKKVLTQNLKEIIPTEQQIIDKLNSENYFTRNLDELDIDQLKRDLTDIIADNFKKSAANGSSIEPYVKDTIVNTLIDCDNPHFKEIDKILKSSPAVILDAQAKTTLRDIAKITTQFVAENSVLNEYSYKRLAQAPNTSKAKFWNDTVDFMIKTLNITPEEIKNTRYDRTLVGQLFNEKVWGFATLNNEEYEKFIEKLVNKIAQIDKDVKPDELTGRYLEQLKKSLEGASDSYNQAGFKHTAKKLFNKNSNGAGTLYGISKAFVEDNLDNVKNTFAAILNKANVYRTIYKDPEMSFINGASIPKEVKEEIMAMTEYLTTEGRIADYSVKLEFLRNLTPDKTLGKIDVVEGKGIKYEFYNAEKMEREGTFIPNDNNFFKRVMKTLFDAPVNSETAQVLSKYPFVDKMFKDYRRNMFYEVGNYCNFMYPDKLAADACPNGSRYTQKTPKFRSNAAGTALDEMFADACKQKYNTTKWLKMFGGFGAGLLGFTVLTQFFFGHGRKPHDNKRVA